jgi:peptidoglycan/xylan/chitin deacetylase (PgdA/CDA1 family)
MFHGVVVDGQEPSMPVDDQLINTVDEIAQAIEYFKAQRFQFVRCKDLSADLPRRGRYVHLSFDDGYANNLEILPVLDQMQVPATFFITTGHIESGEGFWWDAVYRYGLAAGLTRAAINQAQNEIKSQPPAEFHKRLIARLGPDPIRPQGDFDRPMTIPELRNLADHPWVEIGNHTQDHFSLAHCSREVAIEQIKLAQDWLGDVVATPVSALAYPYGYWNETSISAASTAGMQLAVGTHRGRVKMPLQKETRWSIGRYGLAPGQPVSTQCRMMRSPLSVFGFAHKLLIDEH